MISSDNKEYLTFKHALILIQNALKHLMYTQHSTNTNYTSEINNSFPNSLQSNQEGIGNSVLNNIFFVILSMGGLVF